MLAAVPIKPFGVAKRRLEGVLDAAERSRLGMAIAANTLRVLDAAGTDVAVITADGGVMAWAQGLGVAVIADPDAGLNVAATMAVTVADGRWAIVHADLPLISIADVTAVLDVLPAGGVVLAPAADGGTTVVAGSIGAFDFAYGPGSFHRHLSSVAASPHAVVNRPGLALDLDTPADLAIARRLSDQPWLRG